MKKVIYLIVLLLCVGLVGATDISSCQELGLSGETYTLIGDVTASAVSSCFEVTASDVSLDCAGNSIINSGAVSNGVYVNEVEGFILNNCEIDNFNTGLLLEGAYLGEYTQVDLESNTYGLVLISGSTMLSEENTFSVVNAQNNDYGYYLSESHNNDFQDSVLDNNMYSVYLLDSENNVFDSLDVTNSGQDGVNFNSGSEGNFLTNSRVSGSIVSGVVIIGDENTLENNVVDSNTYGLYLYGDNNLVKTNTLELNSYGLRIEGGSGNYVYDNYFDNIQEIFGVVDGVTFNVEKTIETNIINGGAIGGNYWGDYSNTCDNEDQNSFCDLSYEVVSGVYDELPLTMGVATYLDSCGYELATDYMVYYLENDVYTVVSDVQTGCFLITGDEIALDGEGYSIIDEEGEYFGVQVSGDDVIVRELTIQGMDTAAIVISGDDGEVYENTFSENYMGLYLSGGNNVEIYTNYFLNSAINDLNLEVATDLLIYNNYFSGLDPIAQNMATFSLNVSETEEENIIGGSYIGGNYWSNSEGTGYSETCDNDDEDSFCDDFYEAEYTFYDELPLTLNYDSDVSFCQSLAMEGGEYYLTQDIVVDQDECIVIEANDVTLNGESYSLDGNGMYIKGVVVNAVSGVTVQDLTFTSFAEIVTEPDFPDATMFVVGSDSLTLSNVNFSDNSGVGVVVSGSDNFEVYDSVFTNNLGGIYFVGEIVDALISGVSVTGSSDYAFLSVDEEGTTLSGLQVYDLTLEDNVNGVDFDGSDMVWNITESSFDDTNFILNGSYTLNFEGILELVNSYLTIDGIYVENQGNLTSYAYDTEEMSYYELEGDMTYEYLEAYCTNLDAYDGIDYIFTGEEICPLANSEFEVDDGTLVVSWDDVTLMTTEPSVTLVVTGENPESTLGSVLLKTLHFDLEDEEDFSITGLEVSVNYTEDELSGLNLDEGSLTFYYFDESDSSWVELEDTLDTESNTVTANVDSLGLFAVYGTEIVEEETSSDSGSSGGGGGGGGSSSSSSSDDEEVVEEEEEVVEEEEVAEESVEEGVSTEDTVEDESVEEVEELVEESSNSITGAFTGFVGDNKWWFVGGIGVLVGLGIVMRKSLLKLFKRIFF